IEQERQLGGTCLRVGCIPSKALLESSHLYEQAHHGLKDRGIDISKVQLNLPAMLDHKTQVVNTLAGGIDGLMKKNGIKRFQGTGRFEAAGKVVVDGPKPETRTAAHVLIATGSQPSALPGIEFDG